MKTLTSCTQSCQQSDSCTNRTRLLSPSLPKGSETQSICCQCRHPSRFLQISFQPPTRNTLRKSSLLLETMSLPFPLRFYSTMMTLSISPIIRSWKSLNLRCSLNLRRPNTTPFTIPTRTSQRSLLVPSTTIASFFPSMRVTLSQPLSRSPRKTVKQPPLLPITSSLKSSLQPSIAAMNSSASPSTKTKTKTKTKTISLNQLHS
jgi:hypothetical protein